MESIDMLQYPTTVWKLRNFLGLCNVYRLFELILARFASPLNKNIKENAPRLFKLGDTERNIVYVIKKKRITSTILALPRLNGQYTIDSDAYDTEVQCVSLLKQDEKLLKRIRSWLRFIFDAKTHYDTIHKK